jgi:Mg-chelatase subunit ChlD
MNKNKKLIIIAVVFICIVFSRINIFAKDLKVEPPETLAVTLVIDTSGSMATTDPQKLRERAANSFIDLLSPEDYLSIITFNTKEEVVLPMQKIQSSDNKASFKKSLSQKLRDIGDTDYVLALNEASKQLSTVKDVKVRKVILFLTDGEPDPSSTKKNDPEFMNPYMDSLWKAVSNLALNKYAVYSIGFSKGVDPAILKRISSSTKGTMKIYDDSSQLSSSFLQILRGLKKGTPLQPPGEILIKPLSNNLYTSLNNQLKIPLEIENTSNLMQTLVISLDKTIGKLPQDRIKIKPLKKVKTNIYIDLDKNLEKKDYDITVKLDTEDTQTKIEPSEFTTKVQVLSKTGCLLRFLKDRSTAIFTFLGILVGLSLLIILLGLLLYRLLVYRNTIIQGKLSYWKEADTESKEKNEFDFSKRGKGKIIITFNKENKSAHYHIFNNEYNYDIELTNIIERGRWKFVEGLKALSRRNNSTELVLKTTERGIFIYEEKIYTSKKIYRDDKFITGGYIFQYIIDDKGKSGDKDKGRNVLK